MEKLFVYGNLKNSEIQKKIIGRIAENRDDSLPGYKKVSIYIEGEIYPILEKTRDRRDIVLGKVLKVSEDELKKLDLYEGDEYKRIKAVLSSGEDAWVYIKS